MARFDEYYMRYRDEFEWLYMDLYDDREALERLKAGLRNLARSRGAGLKKLDSERLQNPNWYKDKKMLGMTLYTDLFAENLRGVIEKIPYFTEQGITYLHLMPILKMPHPDNDGGYAVEDFTRVDPSMGTNADLRGLTSALREAGISLCLDFVVNHTASTHTWANKAKSGDERYRDYYYTYETRDIPDQFESTMPEVFPATAPGNFTWSSEMNRWVMTTFYPFQWDLNYTNPEVFNEMATAMIKLCNMGVEVIRVDAAPYIWKQLGTNCRNQPRVHTILRLMRLITEIVCPGVILKGEVVMAPNQLAPYFGTPEKPECHLLYSVSSMVNLWSALASEDTRLLVSQLNQLNALDAHCGFVNYLRCHDDIGWGLDEDEERRLGIDPLLHKEFLYHFYEGVYWKGYATGALYNYDVETRDARTCGTTASLCGLETAKSDDERTRAIARDLLMHAAMMSLGGFPMLNCGDEIAQLNDWSYMSDPARQADSRNIHRSKYDWQGYKKRNSNPIWLGVRAIEIARRNEGLFDCDAWVTTWDTHNDKVLAIVRKKNDDTLICLGNFSHESSVCYLACLPGKYTDLFTGEITDVGTGFLLKPYQYKWLKGK